MDSSDTEMQAEEEFDAGPAALPPGQQAPPPLRLEAAAGGTTAAAAAPAGYVLDQARCLEIMGRLLRKLQRPAALAELRCLLESPAAGAADALLALHVCRFLRITRPFLLRLSEASRMAQAIVACMARHPGNSSILTAGAERLWDFETAAGWERTADVLVNAGLQTAAAVLMAAVRSGCVGPALTCLSSLLLVRQEVALSIDSQVFAAALQSVKELIQQHQHAACRPWGRLGGGQDGNPGLSLFGSLKGLRPTDPAVVAATEALPDYLPTVVSALCAADALGRPNDTFSALSALYLDTSLPKLQNVAAAVAAHDGGSVAAMQLILRLMSSPHHNVSRAAALLCSDIVLSSDGPAASPLAAWPRDCVAPLLTAVRQISGGAAASLGPGRNYTAMLSMGVLVFHAREAESAARAAFNDAVLPVASYVVTSVTQLIECEEAKKASPAHLIEASQLLGFTVAACVKAEQLAALTGLPAAVAAMAEVLTELDKPDLAAASAIMLQRAGGVLLEGVSPLVRALCVASRANARRRAGGGGGSGASNRACGFHRTWQPPPLQQQRQQQQWTADQLQELRDEVGTLLEATDDMLQFDEDHEHCTEWAFPMLLEMERLAWRAHVAVAAAGGSPRPEPGMPRDLWGQLEDEGDTEQ